MAEKYQNTIFFLSCIVSLYIARLPFHAPNYYVESDTDTCIKHALEFLVFCIYRIFVCNALCFFLEPY